MLCCCCFRFVSLRYVTLSHIMSHQLFKKIHSILLSTDRDRDRDRDRGCFESVSVSKDHCQLSGVSCQIEAG